jgi:hypothetical protein
MNNYYRTLMHISPSSDGPQLWGGPTWAFLGKLRSNDQKKVLLVRSAYLDNEPNRGLCGKAEVMLNGLPVAHFEAGFDCLVAVTPEGSRVVLADHIERLMAEAEVAAVVVQKR